MPNPNYSQDIRKAVRAYWRSKQAAQKKNRAGPKVDAGNRGTATGGKNLDGIASLFEKLARQHGSDLDLSVAQREGRFGRGAAPFVGYCILVEDDERSRRIPRRGTPSLHFAADPAFKTASYQERMQILCERMVQERLYTAAAVLTSPSTAIRTGAYHDLSPNTCLARLITKFVNHVVVETE
ncbi:MAG: PaeR7I family type II restriction endonuclease [Opitutales bacterium]